MDKITRCRLINADDGFVVHMDVVMIYGYDLVSAIKRAQEMIRNELERFAALNIITIYITVKSLVMKKSFALTEQVQ